MTDSFTPAPTFAAVKFKWQKGDDAKTYDYLVPAGLNLAPGDRVLVETKRGETEVTVVEIKADSEMASKPILRRVDPVEASASEETKPVQDWNF
jgi:primosomal protein N'